MRSDVILEFRFVSHMSQHYSCGNYKCFFQQAKKKKMFIFINTNYGIALMFFLLYIAELHKNRWIKNVHIT